MFFCKISLLHLCFIRYVFNDKIGIKAIYNYENKDSVITRDRQNVASTSTPSGPLTSYVLHATR